MSVGNYRNWTVVVLYDSECHRRTGPANLVAFEAGNGLRLGLVRNNWVQDLGGVEGDGMAELQRARDDGTEGRVLMGCPMPGTLKRMSDVRILDSPS